MPTSTTLSPNTANYSLPENNALEVSTTIPPTPNTDACTCLHNKLPCLFKPATSNMGTLTGVLCSLLGQVGGSCVDIGTNKTTGVYGTVASCDPATRLSYAFSQYYELTARVATSCDFAGNATLSDSVKLSPPNVVARSSAVTQCLTSPSAVFTPKASSGAPGPSGSAGGGGGGNGSGGNRGSSGGMAEATTQMARVSLCGSGLVVSP
ncbi:1,3-beta-glucanosyltransferase [Mycena indigotica]|uniref:1,3-beta-glucanosyltransferase n=1 Tax=Mycena indigotica TaxID=2126181 RepID=A0A8H6VYC1_9AGAR|nr:1,3-beta-glucanosyltransferase [Mycena indigotica]KAF7292659.1 1,3-beta-glucanosyltransferase [Mycena indigotica]